MRTCVACGNKTAKRDLLRIVATTDGPVEIDPSGKKNGRGAYICGSPACKAGKLRRPRLEHALRTRVTDDDWLALSGTIQGLEASV